MAPPKQKKDALNSTTILIEAITANGTASDICDDLWLKTKFIDGHDKMLVIDIANRSKAHKGVEYPSTLAKQLGF